MIGTGILGLLDRPGPPGVALIVAFILMYFVRPFLDRKAQQPFRPRRRPAPPAKARPPPAPGESAGAAPGGPPNPEH